MIGFIWLILAGLAVIVLFGTVALIRGMTHPPRKTHGNAVGLGLPTGPEDLGREGEAVRFRFPDGTRSDGWIVTGDRPDGPTVVLTHGFGDSRFGGLLWATLFLPHAAYAVVYDLRAHGNQTAKRFTGGYRERDDLLAVLEQLGERDLTRRGTVLFGCSMGANTALEAAAKAKPNPERFPIVGLILEGPYRHWSEPIRGMFRLRRYPREPFITLAQAWFRLTMPGSVRGFDKTIAAAAMDRPVLILHGTDDVLCPIGSARAIGQACADATLVEFAGGRHLDLAELDPQRYGEALAAFFRRLAPGAEAQSESQPESQEASS